VTHPTEERLQFYFSGAMPEYQATEVEEHLADCEECAVVARQIFARGAAVDHHSAEDRGAAVRIEDALDGIVLSGLAAGLRNFMIASGRGALAGGRFDIEHLGSGIVSFFASRMRVVVSPARRVQEAMERLFASESTSAGPLVDAVPLLIAGPKGGDYTVFSANPGLIIVASLDAGATQIELEWISANSCWSKTVSLPPNAAFLLFPA
jgi:hypothetical protein